MSKSIQGLLGASNQLIILSSISKKCVCLKSNNNNFITAGGGSSFYISQRGLREYPVPPNYKNVEMPEKPKLRFVDKVPAFPPGIRAPKMRKLLIFMRGPEEIHNKFIYKQYGVVATGPGRLRFEHFEMMRLLIGRKMDTKRMFAEWRVDFPWQSVTKKGQGKRMGGGKGPIDHYVTPIKSGRVILEIGGYCEFAEVEPIFKDLICRLPFKAVGLSNEMLEAREEEKKRLEKANLNPYTFKWVIQNNMGFSQYWISPYDRKWFGEHR